LSDQNYRETILTAVICTGLSALMLAPLLLGCQERPLTPTEIQEQHRFEVGCRPEDAQGYERAMPYCGHSGGGR
jgi:hypothetical protein